MMMELYRTFFASLLLHGTFAAALVLSAGFSGGSGSMLNEKVFYIDLTTDVNMPGSDNLSVRTEEVIEKSAVKEAINEPVTAKEKTKAEEELILTDHEAESEIVTIEEVISAETVAYEGEKHNVSHRSEEEVVVNASYSPSSNGGLGIIEGKGGGILSPAIRLLISNAIEKAKTYPLLARRRGIEGTVHVSFSINPNGRPHNIMVMKSSGFNILDKATVKVVKRAAPYPLIESRVEVPVAYRLKK